MKSETKIRVIMYIVLTVLGLAEVGLLYGIHHYLDQPISLEKPAQNAVR